MKRLAIALIMALSITTAFTQNITNAEYFFDHDPGPGNGIPLSIGAPAPAVSFTAAIPVNLSNGFHWLGVRTKDSDGKWSLFDRRDFYIGQTSPDLPIITAAEYFFDHDPGVGNGTPVTILNSGFAISQQFSIPVPGTMPGGTHFLSIRMKDQAGHWSLFAKDSISVSGVAATISCPGNVEVNSLPNLCYAIVNNIDPTVSPAGAAYTYTLSGATTGTGNGSASGLHFGTGVTTVTYALTNSPTINCSFTITIKTIPSVSISAQDTITCGSSVNFVAVPTNAGSNGSYQWKVNGVNVGTNNQLFVDTAVSNGDKITVALTSSLSCASPSTATSNPVVMTVTGITPSVSVTASTTTPCYGQAVTFTANPVYGGDTPVYTWRINNNINNFGGGATFQSSLQDGDSVSVQMHSSYGCASVYDVQSSWVVMHVTPSVMQNLSINASATSICLGQTVTFTALPENASSPVYQWKLNGNNVGSNSSTYQNSTLANHDTVQLSMTSSGCVIPQTVNSNGIVMNVSGSGNSSVIIEATSTSICSGQQVTFTATPTNGGNNPKYEWTLNGNPVGSNSNTFQSSTLQNGDKIKVIMTASSLCYSSSAISSNEITISVNTSATTSVTINASTTNFCYGTLVTFTASPTNSGNPTYEWKVNSHNVGATSSQWQVDGLLNGDTVTCVMTSNACGGLQNVTSNEIVVTVQSPVAPAVYVIPEHNPICIGNTAKFTANPTNGGDHPSYQWKLNGVNVGSDSSVFSYNTAQQGDWIQALMTSSLGCVQAVTIESNLVEMYVDTIRTYYRDNDGDGYGNPDSTLRACGVDENSGWVWYGGDCNDNNALIHPEGTEICGNGIDDNCNGQTDENCTEGLPVLNVKTYPVKEGDIGYTTVDIEVTLDRPAVSAVRLNYATSNDDAIAGSDYVAANGVLTIPPGSSSATIQIKIIGDLLNESNERFLLNFSNPVNVVLPNDPRSRFMIIDNDKGKGKGNNTIANNDQTPIKEEIFKIPTVTKRNQVWVIPQIGNYENEVLIVNVQGQLVNRFVNYHNQTALGNVSTGLYFYRIRIMESPGQYKYYSGRLLITE